MTLTRDEFEMQAHLAISLHERKFEAEQYCESKRTGKQDPEFGSLEAALAFDARRLEAKQIEKELEELASELDGGGFPRDVWVHLPHGEGTMKIKVSQAPRGNLRLSVAEVS
jgi:hypothetical protein